MQTFLFVVLLCISALVEPFLLATICSNGKETHLGEDCIRDRPPTCGHEKEAYMATRRPPAFGLRAEGARNFRDTPDFREAQNFRDRYGLPIFARIPRLYVTNTQVRIDETVWRVRS